MGGRGLSVPHAEVFPVCVVVTREGRVLILSIKQPVSNSQDRPLKSPVVLTKPLREGKEQESGMALSDVKSYSQLILQSVLSEVPSAGLANLVSL